jgi:uncharacterized lipoprotein NlpE involved in copper resistance
MNNLLSLSILWTAIVSLVSAQGASNQFKILNTNYDALDSQGKDCKIKLNSQAVVIYCENGYVAISKMTDFMSSTTGFEKAGMSP